MVLQAFKNQNRDFPSGPVVKNPPYNAGETGSIPGQGTKIPHTAGQLACAPQLLSLRASTRECATNYRAHALWNPSATTRERKPKCHN